jgi:hypothetical protein
VRSFDSDDDNGDNPDGGDGDGDGASNLLSLPLLWIAIGSACGAVADVGADGPRLESL